MAKEKIDTSWMVEGTEVGLKFDTGETYFGVIDGDPIETRNGQRFRLRNMGRDYVAMFGRTVHPLACPESICKIAEENKDA
jgi:hypothetical protein